MTRRKQTVRPSEKLFADDQRDMFEQSYEEKLRAEKNKPVECLGMTFPNDEERRKYFLEKLREKLKDPQFRTIEGFPIGFDEDILALSDPPYYTACPNPFIADFVKQNGKPYVSASDNYRCEPFSADVSEGKGDTIYSAHSYHTKVPPQAIARYILHYAQPGDLVLDPFAGSGMTGVAAILCNSPSFLDPQPRENVKRGQRVPVFKITSVTGESLIAASTRLELHRHGLNDDVIFLKR